MTLVTSDTDDIRVYGPFTINITRLGRGLLEMLEDHPDYACMALGMFPSDFMQILDKQIDDKIPLHYYWPSGGPEVDDRVCSDGDILRKEIKKDLAVYMLREGPCIL